jgi:hypothetical protein
LSGSYFYYCDHGFVTRAVWRRPKGQVTRLPPVKRVDSVKGFYMAGSVFRL